MLTTCFALDPRVVFNPCGKHISLWIEMSSLQLYHNCFTQVTIEVMSNKGEHSDPIIPGTAPGTSDTAAMCPYTVPLTSILLLHHNNIPGSSQTFLLDSSRVLGVPPGKAQLQQLTQVIFSCQQSQQSPSHPLHTDVQQGAIGAS